MKRFAVLIAVALTAAVIVAPFALYFLVFERPIKALPNDVVLSANDLPDWDLVDLDQSGPWPGGTWWVTVQFRNITVDIGGNLTIHVWSFNSSGLARDQYTLYGKTENSTSLEFGDRGTMFYARFYEEDSNGTYLVEDRLYSLRQVSTIFLLQEANVLAQVIFKTDGTSLDPDGMYHEPWMDDVVELQALKIHRNDIPIHITAS